MTVIDDPRTGPTRDLARTGTVIVVGYDGSEESQLAMRLAAERAGDTGTIVPVHVMDPAPHWLGKPYYGRFVRDAHLRGVQLLAEAGDIADSATVEAELIEGDPVDVLSRVAETRGASEIIVGSRGIGRIRSLFGSVSAGVLERSRIPVMVVPRRAIDDDL